MPWASWFLTAIAAGASTYWTLVIVRIVQLLPRVPQVRDGLLVAAPSGGWPLVSVVVPAHNEERVVEISATSILASDYPALEVVFVLDRCSDRTLELLRPLAASDSRLRIIENDSCPADWAGKCNAARVGADAARGSYLLFTDADVRFDPALVRAAMGTLLRDQRGLLSLLPTLIAEAWYEQVIQPVASMTLMRMFPVDKVNREHRRRPFANGQFLLFDRGIYDSVGGHAATKDDLLEDIAFARLVDASDHRVGLASAEDLLVVHMYSSFAAMQMGWKRIFIEACKRRVGRLRSNAIRAFSLGVLAPLSQVVALLAGVLAGGWPLAAAIAVVGWGFVAQVIALTTIYRTFRTPMSGAILFPLGCAMVARVLWQGAGDLAARRPVRWGGREYVLVPQD